LSEPHSSPVWEVAGVPYTSMSEPGGIAEAISVLRSEGLAERLARVGVGDAGDLELAPPDGVRGPSGLLNERALVRLVEASREHVGAAMARDVRPLLVGGDCPVVLGPLAAIRDAGERPGLVMLDGHEDAWPPPASPTGEASDSEVAIALGRVDVLPTELERRVPLIRPSALALIGPRDAAEIAEAGLESLRGEPAFFLAGGEVGAEGQLAVQLREGLERLDADAFLLHVDLDVLSTAAFPAVDYPQPGGLSWAQLDDLALVAARDRRCRGMSVVIYNPNLDPERQSARELIAFLVRLVTRR
jgi:arginase